MAKRVFLVHGWGSNPNNVWYPWLKQSLEEKGFEVSVPEMPNTDYPVIDEWVSYLAKEVGTPDEETYFIGHSIGCQTIMRYLQGIDQKVGGALFVAGWLDVTNLEDEEVEKYAKPWTDTPINFEKVKNNINELTVLISDNDPYGRVEENKKTFEEKLSPKIILEHNKDHYSDVDSLPIALEEFLRIAQ